jgi:hypothetical protein
MNIFLSDPVFTLPLLYLDPGSGSFLVQLLLAAVLGAGVAAKMYWMKIKSWFGGKKEQAPSTPDESGDEE